MDQVHNPILDNDYIVSNLTGFDYLNDPVWLMDPGLQRMFWGNRQALVFWRTAELCDLSGKSFADLIHPTESPLAELVARTLAGEKIEAKLMLRPGNEDQFARCRFSTVPMVEHSSLILIQLIEKLDGEGVVISDEIEDLRREVAYLREAEARFRAFAEAGSDWLWETDRDHKFTYYHATGPKQLADKKVNMLGMNWQDYLDRYSFDVDVNAEHGSWQRQKVQFEGLLPFRDFRFSFGEDEDQPHHASISGKPMYGSDGNFAGYRGIGRDISKQIATESRVNKLRQDRQVAKVTHKTRNEFLANMSHELRTPLNAIIGFAEIIGSELFGPLGDPRYKKYANDVKDAGTHLLGMVTTIFDMEKIRIGDYTLKSEEVCFSEILKSCIVDAEKSIKNKEIKLQINQTHRNIRLLADARALRQVVANILGNAIKFSPTGGTLFLYMEQVDERFHCSIKDQGPGIPEELVNAIQQPFNRHVSEKLKFQDGVGIGLAFAKSIVLLHEGHLELESTLGQGTTVHIELPCKPASDDP